MKIPPSLRAMAGKALGCVPGAFLFPSLEGGLWAMRKRVDDPAGSVDPCAIVNDPLAFVVVHRARGRGTCEHGLGDDLNSPVEDALKLALEHAHGPLHMPPVGDEVDARDLCV